MAGMSNEQVIDAQKATVAADALASQGKLNPAQADRFIDYVIDVTGLAGNARVVRFRNETMIIDKIGVGKRVAMPAVEGKDPGLRRGVSTSKVELSPVEIMVPFEITDTFREINVEGAPVEDHIVRMMATQLGNDSEELYINGDRLGIAALESDLIDGGSSTKYIKDSFLGMLNGWLRLADTGGHKVDLSDYQIGATAFGKMLNAMPAKFKRDRSQLRYVTSIDTEQAWREKIGSRNTAKGDAAISANDPIPAYGTPVVPFPLFPHKPKIVEHITLPSPSTQVQLRYGPVSNVVVTAQSLGATPVTPYVLDTDYEVDFTAGKINAKGGALASGGDVKVTYEANPQILLTHFNNLIVGFGRDIRIEKDRDIFKRVNQYAITFKVAVAFEETDAVVKGVNLQTS